MLFRAVVLVLYSGLIVVMGYWFCAKRSVTISYYASLLIFFFQAKAGVLDSHVTEAKGRGLSICHGDLLDVGGGVKRKGQRKPLSRRASRKIRKSDV